MKQSDKDLINAVLWRITEIEIHFGTVTDKLAIELAFLNDPDFKTHDISKQHISIFRRIVRTGIILTPKFRPPNGHKILDFLIALKTKQEEVAASKFSTQDAEQFEIMEQSWIKFIMEFEGDESKAKQKMISISGKVSPGMKELLNTSYKSAMSKWNTIQDQK